MLALEIAKRYLFAKKSQNAINVISGISAAGVMVATAALVIILSVFNGLNGLVRGLFGSFDPDLKVVPVEGKTFLADSVIVEALEREEAVTAWAPVLEDNALIRHGQRQVAATIMGVGPQYASVVRLDTILLDGEFDNRGCVLGATLSDQLGVTSYSYMPTVTLYAPKRIGKINMQNPEASFIEVPSGVSGTFLVQQNDYDGGYVLAPIITARELFGFQSGQEVTSIAVRVAEGADPRGLAETLNKAMGEHVVVKDKWHQHESFFRMMEVEKFMAFFILLFIVIIAAFNIIGSLSMLIFEKRESIGTLRSMGADETLTTRIFLFEGWLVSVGGSVLGIIMGIGLVMAQERWSLITFGSAEDYIVSAYPVELQWLDVALVFVSVVSLAIVVAWYPVKILVRGQYNDPCE